MPKKIIINEKELFDNSTQQFINIKKQELKLEHSLKSISKWEAKYHKPFLEDKPEKTREEMLYYLWCMIMDDNIADETDPISFLAVDNEQYKSILEYIKDPCTATTFQIYKKNSKKQTITSELIYYWMCANYIPFSCDTWPINRLLTLVEICSIKNDPKQGKMSRREILSQNHALNMARRAKSGSSG